MTLGPKQTSIFMAVAIGLCLVYEALALTFGTKATISEWVWNTSRNPFFIFVCGMLAGHFWLLKSACVHCGKFPYRKVE